MLEKLAGMIREQLGLDANQTIDAETSFEKDLGADSIDLFELVMQIEEDYGVEIPADDLENLTTVGAVVDYLKEKGIE